MFPTALLFAFLILCATPPAAPPPAPAPSPPADAAAATANSALAKLSPEARGKAARRAKFVYRLPDGTVWDSWWYCEFRDVLREFDALPKDAQPSPRLRAWGFKPGSRQVGHADKRPDPLWHTLAPGKHDYTPFIYVNTAHATAADKDRNPMISIEKEAAPRLFQLWVLEYPKEALGRLPSSFSSLGAANIFAHIPAEITARPGEALTGEFFFVTDPEIKLPEGKTSLHAPCRLTHATKLRLNPEQYAAALLAGEVEMIEWSFRRTTDRLGEKFEWTRRVVEAKDTCTPDITTAPEPPDTSAPAR